MAPEGALGEHHHPPYYGEAALLDKSKERIKRKKIINYRDLLLLSK